MLIIPLLTFTLFLICYQTEPRRLLNGFLFNIFLVSALLYLIYLNFIHPTPLLTILLLCFLLLVFFLLFFGIYLIIIALLLNARLMLKRERKSPANLLTLFVAIILIFLTLWFWIQPLLPLSYQTNDFLNSFILIIFYYTCNLLSFLSSSLLCFIRRPALNQDYIIVLGCGIIGKRVPPLLASRIDKAISMYEKQISKNKAPILIFSGGQGNHEDIPESVAMQQYAISKGVPIEHILIETKSKNTYQNLKFSKEIMDNRSPLPYHSIFVTNNYHTFRAGLYAKKVGLNSIGIGARTARYYLPTAMIREYFALLLMNKKRHLLITITFIILNFLISFH